MQKISISKLKLTQLNEFIKLLSSVFYYEKVGKKRYYLSLFPIFIQKIIRIFFHVRYSKYWHALNSEGKIIGIVGVYFRECDAKNVLWVSWFCVEKTYRRKGIGEKLLNHVISYAKSNHKKRFKIYTSNMDEEKNAQILYEKLGFFITAKEEMASGYIKIYREKLLS